MQEVTDFTSPVVNEMSPLYATASFPTPSVTVLAGQKVEVSVLITHHPPQDVFPEYKPIYTGYIIVTNNYETYNILYIGQPWDTGKIGNSTALTAHV